MDTKIYLVEGSAGEDRDYAQWPVRAFTSKDEADAHAESARKRAQEISKTPGLLAIHYMDSRQSERAKLVNEFDPGMPVIKGTVEYDVIEVPFGSVEVPGRSAGRHGRNE